MSRYASALYTPITPALVERAESLIARGALKVPRTKGPCDLWLGAIKTNGSGIICAAHPTRPGVRVSWPVALLLYRWHKLDGQELSPNSMACHTCDVASCANLDHLYLGTRRHNDDDRRHRGSARAQGVLRAEAMKQIELRARLDFPIPAALSRRAGLSGIIRQAYVDWASV